MITAKRFKDATGYAPKDDDLERCNCPLAGREFHTNCGWDHDLRQPMFIANAMRLKMQMDTQSSIDPNQYYGKIFGGPGIPP